MSPDCLSLSRKIKTFTFWNRCCLPSHVFKIGYCKNSAWNFFLKHVWNFRGKIYSFLAWYWVELHVNHINSLVSTSFEKLILWKSFRSYRIIRSHIFFKKGVLKNFERFTENPCVILFRTNFYLFKSTSFRPRQIRPKQPRTRI